MKPDISTRANIELMIDSFYTRVKADDVIGYIFNDMVQLSWQVHIPIMYNFWETILLGVANYKGNPMGPHIHLDKKETLKPEHFERWLELWHQTIDELFEGEKATEAKTRARHMAALIQFKVEESRKPGFVG
jgi:hemoglobin